MTLLEMTLVLLVLLTLISVGLFSSKKYGDWKLARAASEGLRDVYSAQRMYLADNPTVAVTSLTTNMLLPYLPNNATALPTVKSLTGVTLTYNVTVSPPLLLLNGATYDPSGSSSDSLWDVGE